MTSHKKLSALRIKVESIDEEIIALLGKRFLITNQIQNLKREVGMPIYQKNRENALLKKYIKIAKRNRIKSLLVQKLFRAIFSYARKTGIIKRS